VRTVGGGREQGNEEEEEKKDKGRQLKVGSAMSGALCDGDGSRADEGGVAR